MNHLVRLGCAAALAAAMWIASAATLIGMDAGAGDAQAHATDIWSSTEVPTDVIFNWGGLTRVA